MTAPAQQPGADGALDRALADMCREAIEILDRSQDDQSQQIGADAGEAERVVARLRDALIDWLRRAQTPEATARARTALHTVNAALSLIVGVEYPAAGIQRKQLKQASAALRDLLERGTFGVQEQPANESWWPEARRNWRRGQFFHPSTNTVSKATIFGAVFILAGLLALGWVGVRSSWATGVGDPIEQPVPFSHQHHVAGLGIDCRYCHNTVETSSFASIPPTYTCMSCHSQIWNDSPMLQPVRDSLANNTPIQWNRVHVLPDYVYFNHSIHVAKGVACVTCHGQIDQMPLTWKTQSLQMEWCLNCHREPEKYIRPREHVFDIDWQPAEDQITMGRRLVQQYNILPVAQLTSCSTCHR